MKIALSTLLVLTAISAIILASATGDPLLGLGLVIILLPTVVGLFIASILAKRFENDTTDKQHPPNRMNSKIPPDAGDESA